jgi:hypothetical protein
LSWWGNLPLHWRAFTAHLLLKEIKDNSLLCDLTLDIKLRISQAYQLRPNMWSDLGVMAGTAMALLQPCPAADVRCLPRVEPSTGLL